MSVFGGVERAGVNINGNVCLGGGMMKGDYRNIEVDTFSV